MTQIALPIESRENLRTVVHETLPLPQFDLTAEQLITIRVQHGTEMQPLAEQQRAVRQALDAFKRGVYLLIVNDRRVTDLQEWLVLGERSRVQFWRLVPLAGG